MLRCRADSSRDDSVWVEGRHCVENGDIVQALQLNAEGQSAFSRIRTRDGHEGFIRAEYLRVRPVPANCIAKATVHRLDGEASSMLRRLPVLSRESSVWVQGHHVSAEIFCMQLCAAKGMMYNTLRIVLPRANALKFCG